jgi:hypothetical protein
MTKKVTKTIGKTERDYTGVELYCDNEIHRVNTFEQAVAMMSKDLTKGHLS